MNSPEEKSLLETAAVTATTNAWPFAILRNYGSYEKNRTFLSRVFSAQERHPGLIGEIWFGGSGDDPFGDPDKMGEASAMANLAAKPICEKLGIRFSFQQGVTLNHDADDRPHPGIPDDAWVVDRDGRRRHGIFCCTSPFAIDFTYRKAKSIMAALKPDSYWPDDDLRIMKIDWRRPGICFCPRCLELFGKRVGKVYDRESLLAELDVGEKGNAATRSAWCAFNAEMLAEYAAAFRRAADDVSPRTRLGIQACCSCYTSTGDLYSRILRLFAGDGGQAGIRPGGGYYSDLASKSSMIFKMLDIARDAARSQLLPETGQICYEIENWPHIGAIKNPNAMMAECAQALAFGCDSIAFYWGADQNGESPESYDFWLETMHAWRPFHLAAHDAFRGSRLGGVAFCHGSDLMATADWFNLDDGCLSQLAQSGLPVSVEEASPDALFVNARAVESLTSGDLAKVFAGAVLTDPAGFSALQKKFPDLGFVQKLEVRELEGERALATDKRASGYEQFKLYGKCEKVRALLYPKTDDVVSFSEMTADPKACGTCVVPTEFGGNAVVVQDLDGSWPHPCWPGCRRHAILDALDAAVPGKMPARLLTDGYAVSVTVRKTPDGRTAGVLLMNLGGGETPQLELGIRRGTTSCWTVRRPKQDAAAAEIVRQDETEAVVRIPPLAAGEPALIAPAELIDRDGDSRPRTRFR